MGTEFVLKKMGGVPGEREARFDNLAAFLEAVKALLGAGTGRSGYAVSGRVVVSLRSDDGKPSVVESQSDVEKLLLEALYVRTQPSMAMRRIAGGMGFWARLRGKEATPVRITEPVSVIIERTLWSDQPPPGYAAREPAPRRVEATAFPQAAGGRGDAKKAKPAKGRTTFELRVLGLRTSVRKFKNAPSLLEVMPSVVSNGVGTKGLEGYESSGREHTVAVGTGESEAHVLCDGGANLNRWLAQHGIDPDDDSENAKSMSPRDWQGHGVRAPARVIVTVFPQIAGGK